MTRTPLLVLPWLTFSFFIGCGGDDGGAGAGADGGVADGAGASASDGSDNGGTANGGASSGTGGGSNGNDSGGVGTFDPAGGGKLEDCPAYTSGDNLDVCTMSYLTDGADDDPGAIAIHPDGALIYAGSLRGDSYGVDAVTLLGGGDAGIVRMSPDGKGVLSVTRLGSEVNDVAINEADGTIVVSGDFGVAVLDAKGENIVWNENPGSTATFVDAAGDGTVAVAHSNHVTVYDGSGTALGDFSVGRTTSFNDMALDAGNGLVFVTGYKQRDVGGKCLGKYKAGYLRAFDYQGNSAWTNYDWSAAEVHEAGQCSDTTGRGLTMGRDGKLYYVGTSDGGNTVHANDPKDLSKMEADNVKPDKYQDSWGLSGAKTIGYFARMDPATGDVLKGTTLLTRLKSDPNAGNSARPVTIDADEQGNVLVGGATACCVPDGSAKTINGTIPVFHDDYLGGGLILVMSPDFMERHTWTGVRGYDGGAEEIISVAIGHNGAWAALTAQTEVPTDQPLITVDAMQSAPGGGSADAHVTVFRGPQ